MGDLGRCPRLLLTFWGAKKLIKRKADFLNHVGSLDVDLLCNGTLDDADMVRPVPNTVAHGERDLLLVVGPILHAEHTVGRFEVFRDLGTVGDEHVLSLMRGYPNHAILGLAETISDDPNRVAKEANSSDPRAEDGDGQGGIAGCINLGLL